MQSPLSTTLPRVSVIISTRDRMNVLKQCLEYYRTQTIPDLEVLVAVNGGTDGTVGMLRQHFPEVRVVEFSEDVGPKALNALAAMATGDLLWRTDDDAYPENDDTLEVAAEFMVNNPHVVALSGEVIERTIGYKVVNYYPFPYEPGTEYPNGLPLREFCGAVAMIRKQEFLQAGGFWDRFYLEELDVSTRMLMLPATPFHEMRYTPWIKIVHENAFFGQRDIAKRWTLQLEQNIRYQWRYFPVHRAFGRTVILYCVLLISAIVAKLNIRSILRGYILATKRAVDSFRNERVGMDKATFYRVMDTRSILKHQYHYIKKRLEQRKVQR